MARLLVENAADILEVVQSFLRTAPAYQTKLLPCRTVGMRRNYRVSCQNIREIILPNCQQLPLELTKSSGHVI